MPGEEPPEQLDPIDGQNLLRAKRGDRQALMTGGAVPIQPEVSAIDPFYVEARYTTADFFPMFGVRFAYGRGWSAADDEANARVVVINGDLNDSCSAAPTASGKTLRIAEPRSASSACSTTGGRARISTTSTPALWRRRTGVRAAADLAGPAHGAQRLQRLLGQRRRWRGAHLPGGELRVDAVLGATGYAGRRRRRTSSTCIHYSQQQKALGNFVRAPNVRLRNVRQWLAHERVKLPR